MVNQEVIFSIALSKLKGLSLLNARVLVDAMGAASEVFAHRKDILQIIPDASKRLQEALGDVDDALRAAEQEAEWMERKHVRGIALSSDEYPLRLKECEDAPLVLYLCGDTDLNRRRIISIIGTRKCSDYGRSICCQFVADLKRLCPDALIVSGLAYGIDVCAHRTALENGMDTIGVLAHGLDTIYPSVHRRTATEMVRTGGGLLTEYTSGTALDRMNFVRRNRIVAGICDACVVVESSAKGGSLITAELASGYGRDVFAFPGRADDVCSVGCNNLIKRHQATLLTSAEDLIEAMGWQNPLLGRTAQGDAVQQELFPELNEEELMLVRMLRQADDKHINQIVAESGISYSRVSMILFDLEMKGIVKALGGARYRIVRRL